MGVATVSFALPEEVVVKIDEIASNRKVDREEIFRDALAIYLDDYQDLQADLDESERQIAAGQTISHEEVVARFHARFGKFEDSEAS